MTQDRIVISSVAEPADIAAFPLAPDKPIFRFPVIRDSRWDSALESLASALELRLQSRDVLGYRAFGTDLANGHGAK